MSGAIADKASRQVGADEAIVLQGPPPRYVSRGGEKLAGAIAGFHLDPAGCRALDAGASTGGFTDCLLQHEIAHVVAVDVGYGQLHERVAVDPRVQAIDRTNIRGLTLEVIGDPVDLVVADLSFISLTLVLDALLGCCRAGADLVVLVKPQFEAGKAEASKGKGIISDPGVWRRVLLEVIAAFVARGATIMGVMVSPITGTDGNVEFLLHAVAGATSATGPGPAASIGASVEALVDSAITSVSTARTVEP